ncbi:MAG: hypothetical protein R6U21_01515 [Thermoplasmatota archaeon]
MSYFIPSDKKVRYALKKVLRKAHRVPSQTLLTKLVQEELCTSKKKYGLSPQRLRKIAIESPFVSLDIHSREGDPKKTLSHCPVCHHFLTHVKNLTIWGGEVTIQFRCSSCGYWTGKKKRVPTRYSFQYTGKT